MESRTIQAKSLSAVKAGVHTFLTRPEITPRRVSYAIDYTNQNPGRKYTAFIYYDKRTEC